MNRYANWTLLAFALALPLRAQEEEADPPAAVDAAPAATNTIVIAPALVAVALTAGTGAMILSNVDWSDDDAQEEVLGVPAMNTPADGAALPDPLVVFTWKSVKGAASYLLDIDLCDGDGNCGDFRLDRTPDLSLTSQLPMGATGRWRVRAVDAENIAGPWSALRSFRIVADAPVE